MVLTFLTFQMWKLGTKTHHLKENLESGPGQLGPAL